MRTKPGEGPKEGKDKAAKSSFEQAFKAIDDVLWKEQGCSSELDYTEQTSWLLFLKYLDALEHDRAAVAELEEKKYDFILAPLVEPGAISVRV